MEGVVLAGSCLPLRAENVCRTCRTLNKPCYQILKPLSWSPSTSPASPLRSVTFRRQRLYQICFPVFAQIHIMDALTSVSARCKLVLF